MNPLRHFALLLALLLPDGDTFAAGPRPLADVHLHYKWSQKGVTSAQQAVDTLAEHRIEPAVMIGTPPELALELQQLAPQRVIPIWSPYRDSGEWSRWAFDEEVPPRARAELSARDPWRFVRHPITADDGALLPDWEGLIRRFPERFMVGSDPVWPVDAMDGWDRTDTGWEEYGRFIGFHRDWLGRLEPELARKLRLDNARRLFDGRASGHD